MVEELSCKSMAGELTISHYIKAEWPILMALALIMLPFAEQHQ